MSNLTKAVNREQALTSAVKIHRRTLLSRISRRIRDQAEAEDITQEVFEEFFEFYDLNLAIESLGAWLFTVAQNKVLDRFRRKKTESNYRERTLDESPMRLTADDAPDEAWSNAHLRGEIREALALLPIEQRDVFVQHELAGKSFQEISKATGVSINTLLARKRYAILFLRTQLKEIHDEHK
jgi:RNA polymerase sigma factor (sigma-70 family)